MSRRLLYVMDPMCSWCWGFAPVAQALAEQAAASGVEMHLVVGGLRRDQIAVDASARERYLGYWRRVQQATGQPFDFEQGLAQGLVYDTEPACRAVVTARSLQPALAWPMAKAIEQAFYVQALDVTRANVLLDLAEQIGISRTKFAEGFDSEAMAQATAADFAWVQDLGIAGFPTLLAEGHGQVALLTNGYQPLDVLAPLLARWLEHGGHA